MAVSHPIQRIEPTRSKPGSGGLWRWLLTAAPLAVVAIVLVMGGLVAFYIYETHRRGAIALSNDLIDAVDQRIALQFGAYLTPADQLVDSARAIAGERGAVEGGPAVEPFVLETLAKYPQLTGFSYADPEGSFFYVVRNPQGGLDTKLIDRRGGGHRVTWTRRNPQGEIISTSEDPTDTYDPRTRSWYKGAVHEGRPFWTTPYLFYTIRRPGITYAEPKYAADRRLAVVFGVDIELASLGSFLKSLHIGVHGKAMVVSARGRVIAYPSEDWSAKTADGAPLPLLSDLGDPLLTRIYDRLKVEGFDREIIEISGHRIFASSAALKALTGRNWSVLIVAEQSELLGFVGSSAWLELGLVVVVFLLIAGLAALMIWRSRLAERHDLEALQRQQALEARAQTLSELAGATDLMDRSSPEGVRELTERTGEICGARRVGAWYLTAGGRTLVCDDNFDRLDQAHTAGAELHRDEFPSLFAALESRAAIIAPHAARDPRTAELATLYLRPLGVEGVHITPLHYGDRLVGMLKVEDPVRGEARAGMTAFCAAVASMLALRYGAAGIARQMVQTEREPTAIAAGAWDNMDRTVADHQSSLGQRLLHYGLSEADIRAASIASAAVAAIQLPGWLTVARGTEGSQGARMDMLMDEIQRIVARVPLAYATLLDDQVVLVAHSGGRAIAADGRDLAKGSLELRNRLLELTGSWEGGAEFRIGVDVGPVMMSSLADGSRSLWGGAITIAKVLAGSGGRRAITASEAAYQILSGDFLFRQRGSYFLPETGTMRTFVLVGNL